MRQVDELTKTELLEECAHWMSDMNSAFWEARSEWAPSENRGKALFSALFDLVKQLESGEVVLARFVCPYDECPHVGKVDF